MSKKQKLILFSIALMVGITVASFQDAPGYMDADYYFAGGIRLAEGEGFTEMLLWNYLDDPQGLPHYSHTYWMPLSSILAFLGIIVLPAISKFKAAQIGFILVYSFVPLITSALAFKLLKDSRKAFIAGLLAILSGFYLSFVTTTDSFGIYMLLGGIFFLLLQQLEKNWQYLILGLIAGAMHMTRADGLIWLLVALIFVWQQKEKGKTIKNGGLVVIGYLIPAGLWLARNLQLSGGLMAPGGAQALFLTNYDEIFAYPASDLNFDHLWASGILVIIEARWDALISNLQTGLAIQGQIFLGPLALIAAWKNRKMAIFRVGWFAWGMTFMLMSIVFPFSGARGGFFHSGAAFMPLIWASSLNGLDHALAWIGKKRNWHIGQATRVFQIGLVGLAFLVSAFLVYQKSPSWTEVSDSYAILEEEILGLGAKASDVVLVNNPPSYYTTTGRAAIVIPNGDIENLFEVIERYQPQYFLLEVNHPANLNDLYINPKSSPGLDYLDTVWDRDENLSEGYFGTHIFRVSP